MVEKTLEKHKNVCIQQVKLGPCLRLHCSSAFKQRTINGLGLLHITYPCLVLTAQVCIFVGFCNS